MALARTMILTLNAGSSSLKFALFDDEAPVLLGEIEAIEDIPKAHAKSADGTELAPPKIDGPGHDSVLPALLEWLQAHGEVTAAGHRIVHGGDRPGPALIDDALLAELEALTPLAPLHQPHNLAAIRILQRARPGLPQVACFDTAFHQTLPKLARQVALPPAMGFRRYGFHGLSYQWIAAHLPPHLAQARVIVAHLGSGASLCALRNGQSVETTMSTTPLDGLVMATRPGTIDPGIVLALVRRLGIDAAEHALYHEAGLLGLSGHSGDMRKLREPGAPPAAQDAINLFSYRIAQHAAALAMTLGGLDTLVFTGGIGEHDDQVRTQVLNRLEFLSPFDSLTIPTNEEAVIAQQTKALCPGPRH